VEPTLLHCSVNQEQQADPELTAPLHLAGLSKTINNFITLKMIGL